ncbi:MAG: hypothetical protein JJ863_34830 [Deltaproteobacteria bacterium]|nr:hypothetical protein [Deltaproteobacteria bacterium]
MTDPHPQPSIPRRAYQLVAVGTLPLAFLGTYALGRPVAALIPDDAEPAALLTLLAYVFVLLGCVLVWAVLLLPLRRRAGFKPVGEELADIRAAGGFAEAVAKERRALDARAAANDPGYHASFALVGALLTVVSVGLTWVLWSDGYVMVLAAAAALVCPVLAAYHAVQWLRFR